MPRDADTPAVVFERIVKIYRSGWPRRELKAVDDVSFEIPQGEIFGLVGPNRAGKTTLLKILLSVCHASSGRVLCFGRSPADRAVLARVGYVHENHAFPRYLTATQLLEYYAALAHVPRLHVKQLLPELLERVGLADRAREPISRFSKGMVQRLGLAQAMVNSPDLLVFDEPAEGLDFAGQSLIRDVIAEQQAAGRTTILVTHSLSEVERLCTRMALLYEGKLRYLGAPAELIPSDEASGPQTLEEGVRQLLQKAPA